jgi:hypothetical protein
MTIGNAVNFANYINWDLQNSQYYQPSNRDINT